MNFNRVTALDFIIANSFSVTLNANDFFGYACADAVEVEIPEMEKLIQMAMAHGNAGIYAFMAWHEGCEPIKEIADLSDYKTARAAIPGKRVTETVNAGEVAK